MGNSPELCPECGATHGGGCDCSASKVPAKEAEFRLLAKAEASPGQEAAPEVRLIREFKGPTVEDLLMDDGETIGRLPGQVCEVVDAIEVADYRRASDRLDASIGALLRGPGFRRRRELRLLTPLAALFFLALLIATLILCLA